MSEQLQLSSFDYSGLPNDVAQRSRVRAEQAKCEVGNIFWGMYRLGELLAEQQQELAKCGNGNFVQWMESEAGLPATSGYECMNVYKAGKSLSAERKDFLEGFGRKMLTAFASPSTPQSVRETVLEKVEAGEKVTAKEIKELKRKLKQEEADRKEAEAKVKELERIAAQKESEIAGLRSAQQLLEDGVKRRTEQIQSLAERINELQSIEPTVIEREKVVEIIPDGYASLEDAISQSQATLAELEEEQRKAQKKLQATKDGIKATEAEYRRKEQQLQSQLDFRGLYREHRNNIAELREKLTFACQLAPAVIASFNQGIIDPEVDQVMALLSELLVDEVICDIFSAWQRCRDRNSQDQGFVDVVAS